MITFTAGEVFEMAEHIERNGAQFYRDAANTAQGETRDLLLRLAEMEEDHVKTFADMRAGLSKTEKRSISADPNDQGVLYLRAMVEGRVFVDDACKTPGKKSIQDILNLAISLEKDSIIFYMCIKERATVSEKTAQRVGEIIREEIGHILDLTRQLEVLGNL